MLVLGIRKNFMKEVAFAVGSESGKAFGRQLKVEENINLSKVLGVRKLMDHLGINSIVY